MTISLLLEMQMKNAGRLVSRKLQFKLICLLIFVMGPLIKPMHASTLVLQIIYSKHMILFWFALLFLISKFIKQVAAFPLGNLYFFFYTQKHTHKTHSYYAAYIKHFIETYRNIKLQKTKTKFVGNIYCLVCMFIQ